MRKLVRYLAIGSTLLLILLLVGPLLWPIPALEDTVPPQELADPDSLFAQVDGLSLHYKRAGEGETSLVLLHGFGASTYSWREVMPPLSSTYQVVAFDRPAFGLSERPVPGQWTGENPYSAEAAADLTIGLMDALGIEQAVLIGNSMGGGTAILTALRHPQRIQALVLVDAAVYGGGSRSSGLLTFLLRSPQLRRIGPYLLRSSIRDAGYRLGLASWHDPSKFTEEIWNQYTRPLQAENWDRALWEFTAASQPLNMAAQLDQLSMPVLVVTGDDDRVVPTEQSIRLASQIPGAQLVVFQECGHVPQEECPGLFLEAIQAFLDELP